ncbi:DNA primase [Kamptonema cortianum]|nr:DNA primase [Kamptonema cortianum]
MPPFPDTMPLVPQEIIQRILDANDIADVIGSYVPLKRAGVNYKALSPFKKEKTPSFIVSPQKQIFKCFSSGHGGDVIRFIQLYENVNFGEALKILAARAGIEIPRHAMGGAGSRENQGEDTFKDILYDIHEKLSAFYTRNLFKEQSAQIARDYLKQRGVSEETAKTFALGYSPDSWDATKKFLLEKGYPLNLIFQAGLLRFRGATENARPTDNPDDYYDTFRGRLMFTICNSAGKPIAFSARDLKGETQMGKYINSPESPLFKKSRELYGLHLGKRALLDERKAIICEGQLDLIAIHQAGLHNVVASQGTAFTEIHGQILKRYVDEVILCFDSDSAGVEAAIRSVDFLLESDLSVRVAAIPAPDDPDSFIRSKGPESFARIIAEATDFFDFHFDVLARAHDIRSPGGKKSNLRCGVDQGHARAQCNHSLLRASKNRRPSGGDGDGFARTVKKNADAPCPAQFAPFRHG